MAAQTDETEVADPSTAEVKVDEPEVQELDDLNPEQRAQWLQTGKLPEPKKAEESATSDEEESGGQEPEGEPESDTGKKTQEPRKGKGLKARTVELEDEIAHLQDLLAKRSDLRRQIDEKPGAKEAATPAAKPAERPEGKPVRPKIDAFDTQEKYDAAMDEYEEKLAEWTFDKKEKARIEAEAKKTAEAEQRTITDNWQKRTREAAAKHDDYVAVAFSDKLPINATTQGYLLKSPLGAEILYELGKDIENAARIAALDPYETMEELASIKQSLTARVPNRKLTSTAKPGKTLPATNKGAEDELTAAVEADDFPTYQRIANARDVARKLGK